jgi:hypothetical protein
VNAAGFCGAAVGFCGAIERFELRDAVSCARGSTYAFEDFVTLVGRLTSFRL